MIIKKKLSTDKVDTKLGHMLGHMLINPFTIQAGMKLIPAQTGNGTMKMYTNCEINLSVDS